LRPVAFRLRSKETNGAEVDLLADGIHLHSSRWLFQCKNVKRVELADLAKEIGMATLLKSHVIVLVTTGAFRKTVPEAARRLAGTTSLQAVLLDKTVLGKYLEQGAASLVRFTAGAGRRCSGRQAASGPGTSRPLLRPASSDGSNPFFAHQPIGALRSLQVIRACCNAQHGAHVGQGAPRPVGSGRPRLRHDGKIPPQQVFFYPDSAVCCTIVARLLRERGYATGEH
jgi:hypothetical protein